MMQYVLRVEHDRKVLLHNAVTGQLVVLDEAETKMMGRLPQKYNPVMRLLVEKHYLVPENYDEHQQVINLRTVLLTMGSTDCYEGITTYTIFTTTACNARCYYCYEQGVKTRPMAEDTAEKVIDFIDNHCGIVRKVFLTWFGGEPTLESKRIDQICNGLREREIAYQSEIVTNGYLFDEKMVLRARDVWHLKFAQICFDGTEEHHNRTKSFVGVRDNPYQRVMRNIQLLLDAGIRVRLRMNFDIGNYQDYGELLQEAKVRFQSNPLLSVSAHPIIGCYPDSDGCIRHGTDEWFEKTMIDLFHIEKGIGVCTLPKELPYLNYKLCSAASDYAVTITAEGNLVCCPEQFGTEQVIGTLEDGITNLDLIHSWKQIADHQRCASCVLFPQCVIMTRCATSGMCYNSTKRKDEYSELIKLLFSSSVTQKKL